MSEAMTPQMSEGKIQLLNTSLSRANHYLEFGFGNQTVLASQKSLTTLVAVDSREFLLNKVKSEIETVNFSGNIKLLHANLGPTSNNGHPINEQMIKSWPQYYAGPWTSYHQLNINPDLIFINGQLRIACFLYSLMQCKAGTRILWNDYQNHSPYHVIESVLPPLALVDDMAIFKAPEEFDRSLALTILFENLFSLD